MSLSIIKRILIQAGLFPLWLMPFPGLSLANALIILSISFGLLSEGSVSFASICFIVLIQGIISFIIMIYIKKLVNYITGKAIKEPSILIVLWLIPVVVNVILSISGIRISLMATKIITYLSPFFIHSYLLFFATQVIVDSKCNSREM